MKAEIKIPDGWRKVRTGGIVRQGDMFWLSPLKDWRRTMSVGCRVDSLLLYIRKTKKAGKK